MGLCSVDLSTAAAEGAQNQRCTSTPIYKYTQIFFINRFLLKKKIKNGEVGGGGVEY